MRRGEALLAAAVRATHSAGCPAFEVEVFYPFHRRRGGFTTAAALVHDQLEARDEKRLLRLQRQFAGYKLLIIDELGYVPLSQTGAELLFEAFS